MTGTTDFGFEQVTPEEKTSLVQGVFSAVAPHYDLMNDAMSLGLHRLWKARMIEAVALRPGIHLLDVAGGTGDIAMGLHARAIKASLPLEVTVLDLNAEMLQTGADRAINGGILRGLTWVQASVEELPFEEETFDAVTIAFGLRNVTHPDQALREMRRVLKPGGQFLCLEFSPEPVSALKPFYDFYSFRVLPRMGKLLAGNAAAYQYLAESIRMFPAPEVLAGQMTDAGFTAVSYERLAGGIVALHQGWRETVKF